MSAGYEREQGIVNIIIYQALSGYFEGTAQFGGDPLTSAGGRDAYVAIYDTDGMHRESHAYGDAANQSGEDIEFDAAGDVLLTGSFGGSINFGNGPLTSAGDYDIFLTKLCSTGSGIAETIAGAGPNLRVSPLPVDLSTTLRYSLPRAGWVRLAVHDAEGRQLETLVDRFVAAGEHSLEWQSGDGVCGVRFIRMDVDGCRKVRKIVLVE